MKTVLLPLLFFFTMAALALPDKGDRTPAIQTPPFGVQNKWPFYEPTKYLKIESFNIHILGTPSASDWMMRESYFLIRNMVAALKRPEDREKFSGHQAFLITDDDPALPGTREQRNTGGHGFSLFNEDLVCTKAVDTLYPNAKPVFRAWDTPVHEFGHAIEETLKLQSKSDAVFSQQVQNYNPKVAREYFAWAVQAWFASSGEAHGRNTMPDWQFKYLSTIFAVENKWTPVCNGVRPSRKAAQNAGTIASKSPTMEQNAKRESALSLARHVNFESLAGNYQRNPVENKWHAGSISIEKRDNKGRPIVLRWTNRAGKSWRLFPDLESGGLRTDEENPYYSSDPKSGRLFKLAFDRAKNTAFPTNASGFWFQNQLFVRTSEIK